MYKIFKRILLVFVLLISTVILQSCKTYDDMEHIYHNDILSVEMNSYYVYVYRPNCEICKEIEEIVYNYAKKAKKDKDLPNLYVLNKGDTINNKGIYTDTFVDFVGTTSIEDIKTASSPFLMKIKNGKVTKTIDEKTKIINELQGE